MEKIKKIYTKKKLKKLRIIKITKEKMIVSKLRKI